MFVVPCKPIHCEVADTLLLLLMIFPITVEHFMRHKSEALDKFMEFKAAVEKDQESVLKH